jgi:hypothetical protein
MVYYTVTDCNGVQQLATQVIAATNAVPSSQQSALLGYTVSGNFAQSSSVTTVSTTPSTDRKLWIIGAVLGPVAFVLLLIGLFCFLHYKCRPRSNNLSTAHVYLYN